MKPNSRITSTASQEPIDWGATRPSHASYSDALRRLFPALPRSARLFTQMNCLHETSYGRGWSDSKPAAANSPIKPSASRNHGAITTSSAPFFYYGDSRRDAAGNLISYGTKFAAYPDDRAGMLHAAAMILQDNVLASCSSDAILDLTGASAAMFDNGYYTGVAAGAAGPARRLANIDARVKWLKGSLSDLLALPAYSGVTVLDYPAAQLKPIPGGFAIGGTQQSSSNTPIADGGQNPNSPAVGGRFYYVAASFAGYPAGPRRLSEEEAIAFARSFPSGTTVHLTSADEHNQWQPWTRVS